MHTSLCFTAAAVKGNWFNSTGFPGRRVQGGGGRPPRMLMVCGLHSAGRPVATGASTLGVSRAVSDAGAKWVAWRRLQGPAEHLDARSMNKVQGRSTTR